MKPRHVCIQLLAVLLAVPFGGTSARAEITIDVVETFDFPGGGNLTRPQKINQGGDIVGVYLDSIGVSRGFSRVRSGHFRQIVEPNDTAGFTEGRGINNARAVCGDYLGSDGAFHGFFLNDGVYTEFDVAGALATEVLGINNAGDFAGSFVDGTGLTEAFISVGGTITTFTVPDGTNGTLAYQLNATNQCVGYYIDSAGTTHGFFRDSDGTLTYPLDPPDSPGGTIVFGMNDKSWIVGRYVDGAGLTHGFFHIPGRGFKVFDYPGSTYTSLNGVNRQGFICGRYLDASGIEHGILAHAFQTRPGEASRPTQPGVPSLLMRPVTPLPAVSRNAPPAS